MQIQYIHAKSTLISLFLYSLEETIKSIVCHWCSLHALYMRLQYKETFVTYSQMNNVKDINARMRESRSIYEQIRKMGILVDNINRNRLKNASNNFLKTGTSSMVTLRIDEKSKAVVYFKNYIGHQSGVILEHC